ncbi:MAG: rod-binding protein [Chromatocurvus sp.]
MQTAAMYNDFGALAALRLDARQDADAALETVAAQFESLFLQMMLKSMRDAVPDGGLFNSSDMETYRGMADQQMSVDLAAQGGIGLADVLVRQLQGGVVGATGAEGATGIEPAADDAPGLAFPADNRLGVEPARLLRELGTPDAAAGALKKSSTWSLTS